MSKRTRMFRKYRGDNVQETALLIQGSVVPTKRRIIEGDLRADTEPMKADKALRIAEAIHRKSR